MGVEGTGAYGAELARVLTAAMTRHVERVAIPEPVKWSV